jgi:type II secretory pathway pseudopilin PulG
MSKRSGATLVEVLVAIFIMSIGLLALLALFPLGVISMAQAIQDDRASHCASNATSLAVALNLHLDANVVAGFKNPGPDLTVPNSQAVDPDPNGPSWPVFVDGVGNATAQGEYSQWLAAYPYGITRKAPTYANSNTTVLQSFTLLDDLRFGANGAPSFPVDREGNFSWAYLMRRPRYSNAAAVNMDVVVYSRRSVNLSAALAMPEYYYTGQVDLVGSRPNVIVLTWSAGQNPPPVRAGGWILDATPNSTQQGGQTLYSPGHARFYRVVGINEVANPNTVELEVQDNLQDFSVQPGPNNPTGRFIVLDSVVEVFPRGTQWRP